MRRLVPLVIAGLICAGGCGDEDPARTQAGGERGAENEDAGAAMAKDEPADDEGGTRKREGARLRLGRSEFGRMLFDSNRRAVYIFERDPKGASVCYGECAEAWPPVLTDGRPVAGEGVKASLLGTVRRRGGGLQVTYAGKPLYLYAHEGPGQVLCHDVNLNGGYWWVVGADGARLA